MEVLECKKRETATFQLEMVLQFHSSMYSYLPVLRMDWTSVLKWMDEGADPNVVDVTNGCKNALQLVCYDIHLTAEEQIYIWMELDKRKCNWNHRDVYGNSVFLHAVRRGHLHLVEYFLEKKGGWIRREERGDNGKTAFHIAWDREDSEMVELLVRYGWRGSPRGRRKWWVWLWGSELD